MSFRLPSLVTRIFGDAFVAYAWSLACLAGCAIWMHAGNLVWASVFAVAGLALALLTTRPVNVDVGAEGILIRWLGASRFIAYGEIVDIQRHEVWKFAGQLLQSQLKSTGVLVRRTRGFDVYLVCDESTSRDLRAAASLRMQTLAQERPVVLPELRPSGRPVRRWMNDLRSLLARADYRAQPHTPEALWRVLENPKNELDERAAAALALRAHLGDEARPRLAVVMNACAEPRLRVALEAIDTEDETKTETQLASLTAAPPGIERR